MLATDFIDRLQADGRYTFTTDDAVSALESTVKNTQPVLHRLRLAGRLAVPVRGFYLIAPPEYRVLGCLPPDQFIPALMKWLEVPYYIGLMSAAQYHGSAHQQPQEFQVMVSGPRRNIACGKVRVAFIVRKTLAKVATVAMDTRAGSIIVSTPEATALDLVGYPDHAMGIDNVATIIKELAEKLTPDQLVNAAKNAPIAWVQRLGCVMEEVGVATTITEPLADFVARNAIAPAPLLSGVSTRGVSLNRRWRVFVNTTIEADL